MTTHNSLRLRDYLELVWVTLSKKLESGEGVELEFEDFNVGKSFETAQVRARFTRLVDAEPTSAFIVGISKYTLPDELRGHREVAEAMLEALRTYTVAVKAGEHPHGFDVLKDRVLT